MTTLGIISEADFVGTFAIAKATSMLDPEKVIEKYEEQYLQELLGVELFNLFKADLTGTAPNKIPTSPIYTALFEPFAEDNECNAVDFYHYYSYCCTRGQTRSKGMKEMLVGFIFWEYLRLSDIKRTASGEVKAKGENNRELGTIESGAWSQYNESIETYHAIQWKAFQSKQTDYPKFNGVPKRVINPYF